MATPIDIKRTAAPKKRAAKGKKTGTKAGPKAAPKTGAKARAAAVKSILLKVEKAMLGDGVKATLADYMKLLQLSKEMTDAPKTEIKVKWIEEPPKSPIEE